MDSYNLKTASAYLNNLLLARGLLRNGTPIEFSHPSKGEGGKEATMAAIINLVHDLVLRRDKEQGHQANLAQTLRNLRTEQSRKAATFERLQTRNEDLARQLSLAQSQERAARLALRTAESTARTLKEEMVRLKTTVTQVRTACANDVRKRDLQIQKLKTHLTAQQRGNKTGLVGASISITPGAASSSNGGHSGHDKVTPDVDDPEYNLRQETTEFLTQLSQSLSDENDNLISLVRSTLVTLKELQGIPEIIARDSALEEHVSSDDNDPKADMMHALPTSYDGLAVDMEVVLDNLKNLLTNPNFVPIDEVETREEEILRLREGWEKMEARWREAIGMMDSWRKRLLDGGDTVNLAELKLGLDLGAGLESLNGIATTRDEMDETSDGESADEDDTASEHGEELTNDSDEEISTNGREGSSKSGRLSHDMKPGVDIFDLKLPRSDQVLKEVHGNVKSPRKVTFSAIERDTPNPTTDENASELDLPRPTPCKSTSPQQEDSVKDASPEGSRHPKPRSRKRNSSPHRHPDEPSPKLTVQQKLDLVQAEAEAATSVATLGVNHKAPQGNQWSENVRKAGSPLKTRIRGRPRRRKSTLSPDELEALLQTG